TKRLAMMGQPHPLSDEVLFYPQVDRAIFSASRDAVVVQTGKGAYLSQLTWFDRDGREAGTMGSPGWYNNLNLSPNGTLVTFDQTDPDGRNVDVWVYDPSRQTSKRLTFDPSLDQAPVWSPDGKHVIFGSNREHLTFRLYIKNADGSGADKVLAEFPVGGLVNAWDWSQDGKYILIKVDNELWYATAAELKPQPLFKSSATFHNAQFSPDGRWIAYASNESGNMEIYVSPFPSAAGKWQVSRAGGTEPRWRKDGKDLFYLSPDGKMMAVPVSTETTFETGVPVALFQTHRRQAISSQDVFSYAVSADGKRFLIETRVEEPHAAPLAVLL